MVAVFETTCLKGGRTMKALHFVNFRDTAQLARAVRVFGQPDFIHPRWDRRAVAEIVPGDEVVFAKGTERDVPELHAYDDSRRF